MCNQHFKVVHTLKQNYFMCVMLCFRSGHSVSCACIHQIWPPHPTFHPRSKTRSSTTSSLSLCTWKTQRFDQVCESVVPASVFIIYLQHTLNHQGQRAKWKGILCALFQYMSTGNMISFKFPCLHLRSWSAEKKKTLERGFIP